MQVFDFLDREAVVDNEEEDNEEMDEEEQGKSITTHITMHVLIIP